MAISGAVSLGLGIVIGTTLETPAYVEMILKILSTVLPLMGFVINFPQNTNPK